MKVTVAGTEKEYDKALTVRELIEVEDVDNPLYVTVSINDEFIRTEDFESRSLEDGDVVEFLYFMGGGR